MKGSYTHDVEQLAQWEMSKHVSFYLIPTWLTQALEGNKVNAEILGDHEKLKAILTVEDVKFYNKQVNDFMSAKDRMGFLKDFYPTFLYGVYPTIAEAVDILGENNHPLYENTVSIKDAVSPFISEATCDAKSNILMSLYPIFDFSIDRDKVFVSFGLIDPTSAASKSQESWEKLSVFLIREYGVKSVASSEVFKKVLEVARNN